MKQKNRFYELEITDITSEGFGVSKAPDGKTVFVSLALKGERVRAKIIKEYKSYYIARLEEILKASDYRVEPDCKAFTQCGGCAFRHLDYSAELEAKRRFVESVMKRIGKQELSVSTPLSGEKDAYRNKLMLPAGENGDGLFAGFYARHSHRIVTCEECRLHSEDFTEIAQALLRMMSLRGFRAYDEKSGKGLVRHIYLRRTREGKFCVCVVINGKKLPFAEELASELRERFPAVVSFFVNINTENTNVILGDRFERISGDGRLYDSLLGKRFALSPASFYQVNPEMTEKLYSVAKEFADLKDNEVCLDLYCGAGTVGLCLVNETNKLCGVEIIEEAIENAKLNAEMNGRSQGETLFLAGDARIGIEACKKAFGKPDVIVVDPPRKGLEAKLIEEICDTCPDRVVYISCNPSTLARDVALFAEKGFLLKKIQAVDLFPRTTHVETVVLLSRKDVHERIRFDVNVEELNQIS